MSFMEVSLLRSLVSDIECVRLFGEDALNCSEKGVSGGAAVIVGDSNVVAAVAALLRRLDPDTAEVFGAVLSANAVASAFTFVSGEVRDVRFFVVSSHRQYLKWMSME
jgi:hypothetical protein